MRTTAMRLVLVIAVAAGCSGEVGPVPEGAPAPVGSSPNQPGAIPAPGAPMSPGSVPAPTCTTTSLGPTPLRRLTRQQYDNTIRDLLRIDGAPSAVEALRADFKEGVFDNNAGAISEVDLDGYMRLAEEIAALATTKHLAQIVACPPPEMGSDACGARFAASVGTRALRRPLGPADLATLERLYLLGRGRGGFAAGIELMLRFLLQSPDFLYHVAAGTGAKAPGTALMPLSPFELASRLSYFLWDTMPDDALFAAAASGKLVTREGLRAEAQRLLADPRAKAGVGFFHVQLAGADRLSQAPKDAAVFPQWSPTLMDALRAEAADFSDFVLRKGDGRLATLLTAPFTVGSAPLRTVYGMTNAKMLGGVMVSEWPTSQKRAGLLTQAAFLAVEAHRDQTSPVKRGAYIRQNLFCQEPPPPPPDVNNAPPPLMPNATTRERFEQHRANPACAGCHRLIDPIGFAFEHFDGIGAHRTTDGGKPIDASGELVATDVDGKLVGAHELAARLAASPAVATCVVRQWFRFALGRPDDEADACETQRLVAGFERSGRNVRDLILSLVESDAFRFRHAE